MTRKQKRLSIIAGLGLVLAIAAGLILMALRDQIVFFYSPSEIAEKGVAPGEAIRLGGLVADGSWMQDGETNTFVVTDGATEMTAHYVGILPDLFREGQGVVAEGSIRPDGTFEATNVLAKHDENYLPREVADTLRDQGVWQGGE
ncbi:cytochrome c maturation protein CcmE [Pelagibacterium xiamenense]|uniref:cytochrome c maturation protein CcmE n=1 Tax=Pelagibacterium xiamenense TaxID=2901140 RepID=UPI001E3F30CD|nr:cytochrome c maturation protein CcmE [Pelagibacterium xiamenense]MCD7059512.1 cytochrome c maturation protein CcmE [Pelagibacterium xiamenense]